MEDKQEQTAKTNHPYHDILWKDKPRNFFGLALNFTRYRLTDDKLITSKGFLNIKENEVLLYRVVDKSLKLSLWQRLFRCGSIVLHVKDSDTPEVMLKSIKHPRSVLALLDQVINNAKARYNVQGKDMYGAMGAPYQDIDADDNGIPDVLEIG